MVEPTRTYIVHATGTVTNPTTETPQATPASETAEESTTEPVRRLVTVQRIIDLNPIEGKDRIELAAILGYKCVVKKGEFRIGQLCAFHEVDSNVPTRRACYAFLDDKARDCPAEAVEEGAPVVRRARIRTIKLGGEFSQGLALPLAEVVGPGATVQEGDDLTALAGVLKYEPQNGTGGTRPPAASRRPWPSFAPPKTDEERLQSNPRLLEEMRGKVCYVAGKLDGASMTVIKRHSGEVVVCSRNFQVVPVEGAALDVHNRAVLELGIGSKMAAGTAVQGELVGPGIQKNRANHTALKFFVFNVFRYEDDESPPVEMPRLKDATGYCRDHRLSFVPILWSGWVLSHDREPTDAIPNPERHDLAMFLRTANTQRLPSGFPAEGIVVRPERPEPSATLRGRRLSFKVISQEYEAKA